MRKVTHALFFMCSSALLFAFAPSHGQTATPAQMAQIQNIGVECACQSYRQSSPTQQQNFSASTAMLKYAVENNLDLTNMREEEKEPLLQKFNLSKDGSLNAVKQFLEMWDNCGKEQLESRRLDELGSPATFGRDAFSKPFEETDLYFTDPDCEAAYGLLYCAVKLK